MSELNAAKNITEVLDVVDGGIQPREKVLRNNEIMWKKFRDAMLMYARNVFGVCHLCGCSRKSGEWWNDVAVDVRVCGGVAAVVGDGV